METEPSKTEPPKRNRRRLQFRLRTLLIGVTLLAVPCAFVGWQAKIVRDRNEMREELESRGAIFLSDAVPGQGHPELSPSWLRRLLGDEDVPYIWTPPHERLDLEGVERFDLDEVRRVFPEAFVVTSELPPVG
jgi:hypothetical protein